MKQALKYIGYAVRILIIGTIGFCTYNFISASERVKALCNRIQPGWSMEALRAFAKANDLGPQGAHPGTNYLMDSKSFGRWGCQVEVESEVVKTVKYIHTD